MDQPQQPTSNIPPIRSGTSYLSQAPDDSTIESRDTVSLTLFSQNSVKQLSASDFTLTSDDKLSTVYDNCMIVLFYGENAESKSLIRIFSIVAQQVAGPVMSACNLMSEKKVAEAFMNVKSQGSHPLHWASMRGYPFILAYRGGYPVAFFNGDRSVQAIIDWSMTLACEANYYERYNLASSIQAEATYQMTPNSRYPSDADPLRTESSQYSTDKPIRGYNSNLPITYQGSQEAQQEIAAENQADQQTPPVQGPQQQTPLPGQQARPQPQQTQSQDQPQAPINLPR